MSEKCLVWLLLVAFLLELCSSDWMQQCSQCECKWAGGKKVANCSSATPTSVPGDLHRDVQVLLLDGARISRLEENIFNSQLPNLQKIFMRESQLQHVHRNAFAKLEILIEVDLSHNNITRIEPQTFSGNQRLKEINLSHNSIQTLQNFVFPALKHLKLLDLSFCKIKTIEANAFANLRGSIETIKLAGNQFYGLKEDVFDELDNLKSLELHRNPWKCDCNLKSFREWVVKKGLYNYPTTCASPERLSGKLWEDVSSLEFACKPEITVSQGRVYSQPGSNATLGCFIKGDPIPEAKWVLRGRIVNNNSSPIGSNSQQLYLIHQQGGHEQWFNLTILSLQVEDADDYNCVAENAGGVSEKNVTITFDQPVILGDSQEPVGEANHTTNFLLAVAGGCIVTLGSVSLVSYLCCVNKRKPSHPQSFSQSSLQSGGDDVRLLRPTGILKHTDYSSHKMEESKFQHQPSNSSYQSGGNCYEYSEFPDLLTLQPDLNTARNGQVAGHVAGHVAGLVAGQINSNQAVSDQVLDATSLEPPCTGGCTIPTAAILPPPPSFLAPYPSPPVQTVPLRTGSNHVSGYSSQPSCGFITLPRNFQRPPNQADTKNECISRRSSVISIPECSGGSTGLVVPPPVQFTTTQCCTNQNCTLPNRTDVWVKTCQTLPHKKTTHVYRNNF